MGQHIFIGIDGGGTGCRVEIQGPDGVTLGQARGGPANVSTDFDGALGNLGNALGLACAMAGLGSVELGRARLHAGLAGVIDESISVAVVRSLDMLGPFARCTVSDDREIQTLGALGGEDGYLLAIGTGTIVARSDGGRVAGVDGWGLVLSDHGSGADLGRAALKRTLLAFDGIERSSPMTESLLAEFEGPPGIVAFAATAAPHDFATLAPRVISAAAQGDPQARAILSEAAAHLDRSLIALGFASGDRLCLSGGVGPVYRDWLKAAQSATLVEPRGTPLNGALQRARATQ